MKINMKFDPDASDEAVMESSNYTHTVTEIRADDGEIMALIHNTERGIKIEQVSERCEIVEF